MRTFYFLHILSFFMSHSLFSLAQDAPVKIAIAGMTHGHVGWILNRENIGDIELVGLAEPNEELAKRLITQSEQDTSLWYRSLDELLLHVKPDAVCAFGSIYEHLEVVEKCAPLGIHVMVEKPLAVNLDHAKKMSALAKKHNIQLLTNYETTWYASNHKIRELYKKGEIGEIRKMVIHDGHEGPIEIGCSKEFLAWLTDPIMNGGGAIIDFGCYGANLSTWFMDNQKPLSVIALSQQIKPHMYPEVDDEATIILEYKNAQAIIQASWNWPYSRKDIEVYGQKGALIGPDANRVIRKPQNGKEVVEVLQPRNYPHNDPFAYLASVIKGDTDPSESLYSLKNNLIVVEILSKAIQSSKEGKRIYFNE